VTRLLLLSAICGVLLQAGCGGPCTPGQSIPCTCTSGARGAQVCREDQTYGPCDCTGNNDTDSRTHKDSGIAVGMDGVAGPPPGAKRVFVTSSAYPADLFSLVGGAVSGLHAGDLLCEQAAQGALLGGKWKAWLSGENSVGGKVNAIDRISDVGPWHRLDGVKVFNNRANLGTTPLAPLAIDERGAHVSAMVWTGTVAGGSCGDSTCYGWCTTSGYHGGQNGISTETDSGWTDAGDGACSGTARLYCFEQ
jgi:hypothetical protein